MLMIVRRVEYGMRGIPLPLSMTEIKPHPAMQKYNGRDYAKKDRLCRNLLFMSLLAHCSAYLA